VQDFKDGYADRVETVETAAAEEGVPEVSESPAEQGGDASAVQQPGGSSDEAEERKDPE
jgi:hypothetical protein